MWNPFLRTQSQGLKNIDTRIHYEFSQINLILLHDFKAWKWTLFIYILLIKDVKDSSFEERN